MAIYLVSVPIIASRWLASLVLIMNSYWYSYSLVLIDGARFVEYKEFRPADRKVLFRTIILFYQLIITELRNVLFCSWKDSLYCWALAPECENNLPYYYYTYRESHYLSLTANYCSVLTGEMQLLSSDWLQRGNPRRGSVAAHTAFAQTVGVGGAVWKGN